MVNWLIFGEKQELPKKTRKESNAVGFNYKQIINFDDNDKEYGRGLKAIMDLPFGATIRKQFLEELENGRCIGIQDGADRSSFNMDYNIKKEQKDDLKDLGMFRYGLTEFRAISFDKKYSKDC